MSWKKLGLILEWLGAIYFIGFAVFGLISVLILLPTLQSYFAQSGQSAIFGLGQDIIGPLLLFFLLISSGAWYQGKELSGATDLNWYDKLVAVALLTVLLVLATPQLFLAISSLISALKG